MSKSVFIRSFFLSCLVFVSAVSDSDTHTLAPVTYSIVPLLHQLEETPPEKYPETYLLKINELLKKKAEKIRVVTYNVLFNLFDDQLKDSSYSWTKRLPNIYRSVENMQPDIFCVQETYPSQLQDLQKSLGDSFLHFVGDATTGELNAVFYNKERFELDLSTCQEDAIDLPSASLVMPLSPQDDASMAAIPNFLPPELEPGKQLTLVHLHDKLTSKKLTIINTHLTFYRINSREKQARFISELVQKLHSLNKIVVLTGDFNTFPNRPDREGMRFYDGSHICQIFQAILKDTKEAALLGHVGPLTSAIRDFTYRKHQPVQITENPEIILDHVFVSPSISVLVHAIEPSLVNGSFPSDHMPVIADILLP